MKVLVACEMSGRVTDALLRRGVDAWSSFEHWAIGSCPGRSRQRSLLSPYFAEAMAAQWSEILRR